MNRFYCKDKSTVYVTFTEKPIRVEVYNDKGKVYFFRELGGKFSDIKFNICHPGHYSISEDCSKIKVCPLQIEKITVKLPEPDRNSKKPVSFVYNPSLLSSPARINTATGKIETGFNFKKYPFPVRLFILCHEIGHFYYSGEEDADLFACKIYVNNGYNKSNAFYSLSKILKAKPENKKRVLSLFKTLQS